MIMSIIESSGAHLLLHRVYDPILRYSSLLVQVPGVPHRFSPAVVVEDHE
jgi:hypothetical protein